MSLYPGGPRIENGKYVLDDASQESTMAEAIEEAMADLFEKVKNVSLPETGKDDRRLLFVAISRGILKYLNDHQGEIRASVQINAATGTFTVDNVNLKIVMDKP